MSARLDIICNAAPPSMIPAVKPYSSVGIDVTTPTDKAATTV
jgi:hypothetical protein